MSSVKSWSSLGGGDKEPPIRQNTDDIVKMGYLKKLKTMKRKYFVLRKDSAEASARLEYYDSEKKFRANNRPKRSITLKTCFNINRRNDTRQKWVIALYTKNDCFCLVLESDAELEDWLKKLLTLQHGEDIPDGEPPRPAFEHVWQVVVQKKELGLSKNILGPYHLCLTDKTLSLVKMELNSEKLEPIEFSLHSIRRCGELESFFYLELGQMAVTGAGNLWMQTEDNNIAQNMHAAILSACKRNSQKDFAPKARHRSSSATEASKPITVNLRWSAAHPEEGSRPVVHSKSQRYGPILEHSTPALNSETVSHSGLVGVGRERCASMPSRPRTSSEGGHRCPPFARPSSIYNSYSPQMTDLSPVSPEREGLTDSSLSMEGDGMEFAEGSWQGRDCENRLGHSLTPEEPVILEESIEDCLRWPSGEEERTNNSLRERSLCLPIQNNNLHYRKMSPNSTSGFKPSSSPSQASLSDMYSPPCGSSPLETSSAYMPMSPGERGMTGVRVGGSHSANHSRGSSLAEEGYVPMAPSIHDDGYVDMDIHGRSNRNLAEQFRDSELSASSSCSITSGTPSTDIRFPEYTLEKVSTYITPSEDDLTPSERPARAYSVGSRPMLNKSRTDILNQSECQQRTRAFSVGSRCPRLPPESTLPPSRRALSSSHSSVEPSEDLMEIDFSKNNKRRIRYFKKPSSSERLSVPPNGSVTSSVASSYSTAEGSSYMDMSPRGSPKLYDKDQASSDYVHASSPKTHDFKFGRSPPNSFVTSSSPPVIGFSSVLGQVPEGETGFIEPRPVDQMRPFYHGRSPPTAAASTSFASPLRRARSPSEEEGAYMQMQPVETKSVVAKNSRPRVDSFPVAETSKPSNHPKTSSLPIKTTVNSNTPQSLKSIKDESSDVNALKRKSSSVEDNNNTKMMITRTEPMEVPMQRSSDDYVQMAPDGRSIRRVSLDNSSGGGSSRNDDYMNMTPGNGNGKHQQQNRNGRKDRTRFNSQPIAIRPGAAQVPTYNGVRKLSSGTPPKVPSYLGLSSGSSPSSSPYSSLSRRRSKAEGLARSESRESNGGGLSTPDTGASTPIFRISLNSPISPNVPAAPALTAAAPTSYDSTSKCPVDATDGTVRISYLPSHHQPSSSSSDQSDYINYNPREGSSSCNDYLPMQPGKPPEPVRKISAPPVFDGESASSSAAAPVVDDVVADFGGLVLNSSHPNAATVSRSPTANSDCSTIVESPAEPAANERQNGHALKEASSQPPPSDRLCSTCPPPTGEKELHYASLDLVKPDAKGRQGTDLRNQSSTSSASTPSPNIQQNNSTTTFTYAEIDFSKNIH